MKTLPRIVAMLLTSLCAAFADDAAPLKADTLEGISRLLKNSIPEK